MQAGKRLPLGARAATSRGDMSATIHRIGAHAEPSLDPMVQLVAGDLNLVNAVNLDGGGSTLLTLTLPGQPTYFIPSFDPVPTVLAVYPR